MDYKIIERAASVLDMIKDDLSFLKKEIWLREVSTLKDYQNDLDLMRAIIHICNAKDSLNKMLIERKEDGNG